MQKIANFMMSKKFIPVILVLTGASLFVAFQSQGKNENDDNPKSKYTKVLRNVGILLEEGHYSPKKIDDNFSKEVLKKFTEELDNEKSVFLQSDIESFKKFDARIDDEIHGSDLQSFFAVNEVYMKRRDESFLLINEVLAKPFDFTKDETIQMDRDKLSFPKSEAERKEVWRKSLKYIVLGKFVELQEDREKNKAKKDYVLKADSTLEREARDYVKKRMERSMTTKKTHETTDENFSTFVNAIAQNMDPHTDYFPPVDKRSFDESMSGGFYGIGAQLKEEDGKIKIASLIAGMPAERNGDVKIDDEIIKIAQGSAEPVDVTGYSVTDAVKLIRGAEKGSEVKLTFKKADGTIKVVSLLRDKIKLEDTFAKSAVINGEHKIGYIYLPEFYQDFQDPNGPRCSNDVAKEVVKLKAENVEGIIIDLRGNGGGSLSEVVKMAGLFIEDGPIVQVKGRDEKATVLRDRDKNILYTGPLTVMVDEFSASASEIFAAAIQDYKRGIIIGSTSTYGKGTVQRNIPLSPESENPLFANKNTEDLGALKLTLQKFYRINGGATQLKGVTPDVVLADRYEHLKFREKDNTSSLSWDEIAKADYQPWTTSTTNDAVVNITYDKINKGSVFSKIRNNINWLSTNSEKESSLNIVKYKEEQKQVKATYKELDTLFKLPKELVVKNVAADTVNINAAKDRADRNKQWLKRLSGDIYIDETLKVVNTMIMQKATAKNN
jgi:carboxyl-terminal processing protease